MWCDGVEQCFQEIEAYCRSPAIGYPLLVNAEDDTTLQTIIGRMESDFNKKCIRMSSFCHGNVCPQLEQVTASISAEHCYVVIGLSQFAMLRSEASLAALINAVQGVSYSTHVIFLLSHAESILQGKAERDPRMSQWVVLVRGKPSPLPRIRLISSAEAGMAGDILPDLHALFGALERYAPAPEQAGDLLCIWDGSMTPFSHSVYSVARADSAYTRLAKMYPALGTAVTEGAGRTEEWKRLEKAAEKKGLDQVFLQQFGSLHGLSYDLTDLFSTEISYKGWLRWLCMKIYGVPENEYMARVMQKSQSSADVQQAIYEEILQMKIEEPSFESCYASRRKILQNHVVQPQWIQRFCGETDRYGKDAIYYLGDTSKDEKRAFLKCLEDYPYTEEEIVNAAKTHFPAIYRYLQLYTFSADNMKVPAGDEKWRGIFTGYFQQYKLQKLRNHIGNDFLTNVEKFAKDRPYNKVPVRSLIMNPLKRMPCEVIFFDALGVEYLGYIQEVCKQQYSDLLCSVKIGHGLLPSITAENKEFVTEGMKKISALDELKHHSSEFDYQKCKQPLHLFAELKVIDEAIASVYKRLLNGEADCIVFAADHGATRLAVIKEEENTDLIVAEGKGEHGGRCCKVEQDPHIPFAAYENGYAVLANYSRFKGSRKASVEVHGGATLEEVLVPVIQFRMKPKDLHIDFESATITLHKKDPASIVLCSSIVLHKPRLVIRGLGEYEGQMDPNRKRAIFTMPEIKRSKTYTADAYDGETLLKEAMTFDVKKAIAKDTLVF